MRAFVVMTTTSEASALGRGRGHRCHTLARAMVAGDNENGASGRTGVTSGSMGPDGQML